MFEKQVELERCSELLNKLKENRKTLQTLQIKEKTMQEEIAEIEKQIHPNLKQGIMNIVNLYDKQGLQEEFDELSKELVELQKKVKTMAFTDTRYAEVEKKYLNLYKEKETYILSREDETTRQFQKLHEQINQIKRYDNNIYDIYVGLECDGHVN